jgi:hypothetical protein
VIGSGLGCTEEVVGTLNSLDWDTCSEVTDNSLGEAGLDMFRAFVQSSW